MLNNIGNVIFRLSELFETQHETVSSWLSKWETEGVISLYDCPRSGSFTEDEKAIFLSYIDENPHQAKAAAARLLEETGKEASFDTFKRVLKNLHLETLPIISQGKTQ